MVCNLAAQAGVRFSIENPEPYIDSNVVGFANILNVLRTMRLNDLFMQVVPVFTVIIMKYL